MLELWSDLFPINAGTPKSFWMNERAANGKVIDIYTGMNFGAGSPLLLTRITVDCIELNVIFLQIFYLG